MPTECTSDLLDFSKVEGRRVVAGFDGGAVTSDAGALLLGATDRAIGLIDRLSGCFSDARSVDQLEHPFDHEELRDDPVMRLLGGRLSQRLAGKSTLNRLEHAPTGEPSRYHRIGHDGRAIEDLFVDLFVGAHDKAPERIVLDLDATDDPLHGHQEGRFFHGYRRSNIDASAGSVEELERIVGHIRRRWPRTRILVRADSGFAREALMAWCEANGVDFLFGLARNARLEQRIEADLLWAEEAARTSGGPARRFAEFLWTTRDSWSRRRRVVAKAEWTLKGANPRFVVTSLKAYESMT